MPGMVPKMIGTASTKASTIPKAKVALRLILGKYSMVGNLGKGITVKEDGEG